MKHKNGFTLMELLIAAAIIGTLAIFATQSFRRTSADVRFQDASARAKAVAVAARRFLLDNTGVTSTSVDTVGVITARDADACNNQFTVQNLVNCGYLEFRQYSMDVREGNTWRGNFEMTMELRNAEPRVCISGASEKVQSYYGENAYCTNGID